MFNLIDDFSNLINLIERITLISNLCFFDIQKFNEKFALFFFNDQVRQKRFASKFRVFLTADPLPNWKITSSRYRYRPLYPSCCGYDCTGEYVKYTNPGIKYSFVFINAEISVPIQKTSKPFKKISIWNYVGRNPNSGIGRCWGFFKIRNCTNKFIPILSFFFSSLFKITPKFEKLFSFYNAMFGNSFNKVDTGSRVGCKHPRPCFFSFISLLGIYFSSKFFLKEIGNFFIGHLCSYDKMSIFYKGNIALCVKKSSKIFHNSPWFGKLHFTKTHNCPQRLNSMERGSILRYAIV